MIPNLGLDHGSLKLKYLLIKQQKLVFVIVVLVDVLNLLQLVYLWQPSLILEIKLGMKILL